jgi:hypothetical protein
MISSQECSHQLHTKSVSYLAELGEEVGHAVLAVPELAEGERDEHGGEEVGEGVVQVGVLRQPPPALQQCEHGWPGAQEQERRQHQGDGATLVLDHVHREAGSDGGQGAQERVLEHLQQGGSKLNGFLKCQRLGTLVCVQLMKKLNSVN